MYYDLSMLDWFTYSHWMDIPLIALFYAVLEYFFPLKKQAPRSDVIQDLSWLYFNELISPQLTQFLTKILIYLFWSKLGSYFSIEKYHFSTLTSFLIIFFYRDIVFWVYHRLSHQFNFLWRFHEFHHSSMRLDWLASARSHWVDILLAESLMGVVFFYIEVSPTFIFFWNYYELNISYFVHTNTNFQLGIINKWLNNPQTHHWHHAKELKLRWGQNFGLYTVIWDHLFNTFYLPSSFHPPEEYGLINNHNYPKGMIRRFVRPFIFSKGEK